MERLDLLTHIEALDLGFSNQFLNLSEPKTQFKTCPTHSNKQLVFILTNIGETVLICVQMKSCFNRVIAWHSLRWQQRQHRLVHGGCPRVWPCTGFVPLFLSPVHHEAILPRPCGKHCWFPTGPGWQAGHPATLRSVTFCTWLIGACRSPTDQNNLKS